MGPRPSPPVNNRMLAAWPFLLQPVTPAHPQPKPPCLPTRVEEHQGEGLVACGVHNEGEGLPPLGAQRAALRAAAGEQWVGAGAASDWTADDTNGRACVHRS